MRLNPPRVGELLAGVFGALLLLSLLLPWYRTPEPATARCDEVSQACPRATVSGFEAFGVLDVYLLVIALVGVGLLVAEVTQRTSAIPTAWAALAAPLAFVAAALALWRTLAPPGGSVDEPLFALLGTIAAGGITVGSLLSMRNEGAGAGAARPRAGARAEAEPELLAAPTPPADSGTNER